MTSFTAACIQLRSGKTISDNADAAESLIRAAAKDGAQFVQTPEMSNVLVRSREELLERISDAEDDLFLKRARALAAELGIHLHLGSLAVLAGNGKVANRAFLIGPDGKILATYDKIHMFDVDLENAESYRESASYRPGDRAVLAETPWGGYGMGVCYDVRFPALFREERNVKIK